MGSKIYLVAQYARLSREEGDRPESDSIQNQQLLMDEYCTGRINMRVIQLYSDEGYTGTNFDRPAFRHMLLDIETGKINCVVVKDLSRFGRDYIDMGYYLERWFPAHSVRFIAINDGIDSLNGPYDVMLPLKNVFNTQYARDISQKVRASLQVRQTHGKFVGAFACYGYRKDPEDHSHLIIDPAAAQVVLRIFHMAARGVGQLSIAKTLNKEGVPCPSEYKRLMGANYRNCRKLESTTYWTYATIHRMLSNRMYLGEMVQARSFKPEMNGKAVAAAPDEWITVPNTHEAIVPIELWDSVQAKRKKVRRPASLDEPGLFAGYFRCGDCGRAMVKNSNKGTVSYCCSSYKQYGSVVCSKHYIAEKILIEITLKDLNRAIATVPDLEALILEEYEAPITYEPPINENIQLTAALERVRNLKQSSYEDYRDKLLTKEEFIRYKEDYDQQEANLVQQLEALSNKGNNAGLLIPNWINQLRNDGRITQLDRITVSQTIKEIRLFADKRIEIDYLFTSDDGGHHENT